jgi:hypothetical protein
MQVACSCVRSEMDVDMQRCGGIVGGWATPLTCVTNTLHSPRRVCTVQMKDALFHHILFRVVEAEFKITSKQGLALWST